jgi:hypothetical protein
MNKSNGQIVVERSAAKAQIGGFVRAALFWAGGLLVGKGLFPHGLLETAVPALIAAGTLAWQQVNIRRQKKITATLADRLPDASAIAVPSILIPGG